jgi:hypothetical protein
MAGIPPPVLILLPALAGAGCGSGERGGTLHDPGTSSGTLRVVASGVCLYDAHCTASVAVTVTEDATGAPVPDASVRLAPAGAVVELAVGSGGLYSGTTSWGSAFELDVTRGADFVTGVVFDAPETFSVEVDPPASVAEIPRTVRWFPAYEVGVRATVFGADPFPEAGADDGIEKLPAVAVPGPVLVERSRYGSIDSPLSYGVIRVYARDL